MKYSQIFAPSYGSTYLFIKRKTEKGVTYKINKIHISPHKYHSSFSTAKKKQPSEYILKKSIIPMCKILIGEITKNYNIREILHWPTLSLKSLFSYLFRYFS